ncbi:MAG: hypothetical protein IJS97_03205 [Prevotella sp.]|nr:hypothetical protein [Prevotella sp.]
MAAAPQRGANPHSRRRAGWGWVSIAAALLIAFLVLKPLSNSPRGEEDSLSSERKKDNIDLPTLPPTGGAGRGAEKQIAVLAKVTPTPQPMRKHRKAARRQNSPIEKPTLAQAEPIIPAESASLPHVEVQSFHEARVSSMDAENDEVDPKMLLYTAEIEMEKTTHKRQAAYEKELMQHGLELLLYLLTEKEEKQADGTVKTQKS